jgi:hypothetical protein
MHGKGGGGGGRERESYRLIFLMNLDAKLLKINLQTESTNILIK